MIQELKKDEMQAINGGTEISPERLGYEAGRLTGKILMIWATFFKK